MNFLPENIDQYASDHSQKEPEILQELFTETWQKALIPRMISGHFQGRVLSMISKLSNPKTILEIGTYTGYSALCLAEGLQTGGVLHTIDHNEELYDFQRKYFDRSGYGSQIEQHLGNAIDIIPKLKSGYYLVFLDADKTNYLNYYELVLPKMNAGGVILSDNVLWSGKVVKQVNPKDKDTQVLQEFNRLLASDPRIESVLLPLRDGLTLSRVR